MECVSVKKLIRNKGDMLFDISNVTFMCLIAFITFFPFYNIFIVSINDATDAARGGIVFWSRVFSLANYKYVFQNSDLINPFIVTFARTIIGTCMAVFFTAAFAFGVSKSNLLGRKYMIIMAMITM